MYVATNITKKGKPKLRGIWQAIILVFITISIPLGLIAIKLGLDFRSKAGDTEQPMEIVHSNITATSVVISFETPSVKTKATVTFEPEAGGTSNSAFDFNSVDGTEEFNMHYHKLTNLQPDTKYKYAIVVGSETYTSDDFIFDTIAIESSAPTPLPVNGLVAGDTFTEGIVYAHLTDGTTNSTVVSALLPESGAYTLDINSAKQVGGEAFPSGGDLVVFASAHSQGKGFTVGSPDDQFMEEIVLDQNAAAYNPFSLEYKVGEPAPTAGPTEESTVTPVTEDPIDPIDPVVPDPIATATPIPPTPIPTPVPESKITVTNLTSDENIIQGALIFGTAKPNSLLTLKLGTITLGTTTVAGDGAWQFALPTNTPAGESELTISNDEAILTLTIFVEKLEDLPDTAITDYTPYIPGILIFLFGIYLITWTKKENSWGKGDYQKRQLIDILN